MSVIAVNTTSIDTNITTLSSASTYFSNKKSAFSSSNFGSCTTLANFLTSVRNSYSYISANLNRVTKYLTDYKDDIEAIENKLSGGYGSTTDSAINNLLNACVDSITASYIDEVNIFGATNYVSAAEVAPTDYMTEFATVMTCALSFLEGIVNVVEGLTDGVVMVAGAVCSVVDWAAGTNWSDAVFDYVEYDWSKEGYYWVTSATGLDQYCDPDCGAAQVCSVLGNITGAILLSLATAGIGGAIYGAGSAGAVTFTSIVSGTTGALSAAGGAGEEALQGGATNEEALLSAGTEAVWGYFTGKWSGKLDALSKGAKGAQALNYAGRSFAIGASEAVTSEVADTLIYQNDGESGFVNNFLTNAKNDGLAMDILISGGMNAGGTYSNYVLDRFSVRNKNLNADANSNKEISEVEYRAKVDEDLNVTFDLNATGELEQVRYRSNVDEDANITFDLYATGELEQVQYRASVDEDANITLDLYATGELEQVQYRSNVDEDANINFGFSSTEVINKVNHRAEVSNKQKGISSINQSAIDYTDNLEQFFYDNPGLDSRGATFANPYADAYQIGVGPYVGAHLRRGKTKFISPDGAERILDFTNKESAKKAWSDVQNYASYYKRGIDGSKEKVMFAFTKVTPKQYVAQMDNLIKYSPTLQRDTYFYRGADGLYVNGKQLSINEMTPGTMVNDKAFLSTSISSKETGYLSEKRICERILAPAGAKGTYLSPASTEYLLDRGYTRKIISEPYLKQITKPDGSTMLITMIDTELVMPGNKFKNFLDGLTKKSNKTSNGYSNVSQSQPEINSYNKLFNKSPNGISLDERNAYLDNNGLMEKANKSFEGLDDLYSYGKEARLAEHDVEHIKRVSKNALYMAHQRGLNDHQLDMIAEAAKYHDYGDFDGRQTHAKVSAIKAQEDLSIKYSADDVAVIASVIDYHNEDVALGDFKSKINKIAQDYNINIDENDRIIDFAGKIPDSDESNLVLFELQGYGSYDDSISTIYQKLDMQDKMNFESMATQYGVGPERLNEAWEMAKIIKDADAIDRTRFAMNNLDESYFRNESEAKALVSASYQEQEVRGIQEINQALENKILGNRMLSDAEIQNIKMNREYGVPNYLISFAYKYTHRNAKGEIITPQEYINKYMN